MTFLRRRVRHVREGRDQGSALAIALVFLMIFGTYVGIVLQFATTGQRTALVVRDEVIDTYAGGGAIDGAINSVRTTLTAGTETAGTSTCFTLPSGEAGNGSAVTVTCVPRSGSGAAAAGSAASQPDQAVLALSPLAGEGVLLGVGSTLSAQGAVLAASTLTVPLTSTLTSTAAVRAGTCVVLGTSSPACTSGSVPGDPGWAGPTAYPPVVAGVPACATPVVALQPGTYLDSVALQSVFSCPNTVVWMQPGRYYLDFRNNATHELTLGAGSRLVGGTPQGWTPGTTPAASVPVPTAANPARSACDTAAAGVELVFGGDSRLTAAGGQVQLCALSTSTTTQHIVARGMSTATSLPGTASSTTAGATDVRAAGARAWTTPANGSAVDGNVAYVKMPNRNDPSSRLAVGPVAAALVPSDATAITVTATVAESLNGTGNTTLVARPGNGTAATAAVTLEDCPPTASCSAGGLVTGETHTASFSGLSPAQVNGMSFELAVNNPNNSPVEVWVDGITVTVTYTAPLRPTCTLATPTGGCAAGALLSPVLRATAATTVYALHGTVYTPLGTLDLAMTSVPYTVVDRGVVVRRLLSSMTRAAAYTGPLISIPPIGTQPRQVLLEARDGSGRLLTRADVTFSDAAGTANGSIPSVNEWTAR